MVTEREQEKWAGSVNSLDVGGETGWRGKKDSKTLNQADGLKDYAQEKNTELFFPLTFSSSLQFEHREKIPHEFQAQVFLGGRQTWDSQTLRRVQKDKKGRFDFVALQKHFALLRRRRRNSSWIYFWLEQLVSALFDSRVVWMANFITAHSFSK